MLITQNTKQDITTEEKLLKILTKIVKEPKEFYQSEKAFNEIETLLNLSCDLDITPVTQKCYKILKGNFGRENRIIRNYLKILYKLGLNEKANDFCNQELFKSNLNDQEARKMSIAFQKNRVSDKQYAQNLIEYINKNYEDLEAWMELALLYEQNQQQIKKILKSTLLL